MRGQSVTGWWATFPGTSEEPRKFTTGEDAMEWWPECKPGQEYCPVKVVFRVVWKPVGWWNKYEPRDELQRSEVTQIFNPLSQEAWDIEVESLKQAAITKKKASKANKNVGADGKDYSNTLARLDKAHAKTEANRARRKEWAARRAK